MSILKLLYSITKESTQITTRACRDTYAIAKRKAELKLQQVNEDITEYNRIGKVSIRPEKLLKAKRRTRRS